MKSRLPTIIVTALVTALVTSLFWLAALGLAYWYFLGDKPPFIVSVDVPREVAVGDTVVLKVQVANPSDEKLELGSIDIYDTLLNGFTVAEVRPEPAEKSHTLDFSSYYFQKPLQPGKSFTVSFTLKADKAGIWTGDVDCCTPAEKFVTSSTTIRVLEPSAESSTPPDAPSR
jgi:hypothetical protein